MSTHASVDATLLLYHRDPRQDADTVWENIDAFGRYSRFPFVSLNTDLGMPRALSAMRFRVVVLHYSLFGPPEYHLPWDLREWLVDCRADHLIAIFQDEYHYCRQRFTLLNELSVDCVYTQLETEHVPAVYGTHTSVPDVVSHIPGYVSERLIRAAAKHRRLYHERTIDVGYRGRKLPYYMGRSSQEKHEIGVRFAELAQRTGLKIDISSREGDRIYGEAWSRFLGNSKATLGTESGVSIFDLDDRVRVEWQRLTAEEPDMSLEDFERRAGTAPLENAIPYRMISPRHFEAAAFETLQVMYEGRYSGAMEPGTHYLPLAKDFSNFDQVLDWLRDEELRHDVTSAARRDLIESGEFSYERFMRDFDERLVSIGIKPAADGREATRTDRLLKADLATRVKRRFRYATQRRFPGRARVVRVVKPILRGSGLYR